MDAAPSLSAPDTVSANLRMILRGLLAALGAWGMEPAVAVALHRRISGIAGRIERMLIRFRAGRLWRVSARPGCAGAIRKSNCTLPRRFGWLVRAGGHRAAAFRSQLELVLQSPDMAELLAAAPQAGRILRPLCRALALEWPTPEPKPEKIKIVRKRRPRPKPEPFRIPLPRGVISAARRAGFGKLR